VTGRRPANLSSIVVRACSALSPGSATPAVRDAVLVGAGPDLEYARRNRGDRFDDSERVERALRPHLARYKLPWVIRVVENLPHTPHDKI
jgi:hypothetical protein